MENDLSHLNTIPDVINAFGGASSFARLISRRQSTASEMKRRGTIPVRYWKTLIESERGRALGLTSGMLMRIHGTTKEAAE